MNVIIDDELLEQARKIAEKKTSLDTINHALSEIVRVDAVRNGLFAMQGTDWWEGDLEEMRRDRFPAKPTAASLLAAKTAREPKGKTLSRRRSR